MFQKGKIFQGPIVLAICFLTIAIIIVVILSYQDFNLFQMQAAVSSSSNNTYLSISFVGNGSGTVSRQPIGANCKFTKTLHKCYYPKGSTVTLTAKPDSGSVFIGWTGACSGEQKECIVKLTTSKSVTATLNTVKTARSFYTISVTKRGTGSGTITSSTGGMNCGGKCWEQIVASTKVSLYATPASSLDKFVKWSGNCQGINCSFESLNRDKNISATFCINECSHPGEIRCVGTATYQTCKFDSDNTCLIWDKANVGTCGNGRGEKNCDYKSCTSKQRPIWYCSDNACTFTCSASSDCK